MTRQTSLRSICLEGQTVPYLLTRASRRTLGLKVDGQGLRVGAPNRVSLSQVESFLRQHGVWILEKLQQAQVRDAARRLDVVDGAQFPLLGEMGGVRIEAGANRARWEGNQVILALRPESPAAPVLERALRRRGLELFAQRLAHYGVRLGHPVPPLSLSSARTRWGSCSRRSGIRLNWRLIHLPMRLIDYVVAHELAHLLEMNHSPRFWAVVESLYPDWRSARHDLKTLGAKVPLF